MGLPAVEDRAMNHAAIIRDCTYDDIPWMVETAISAYDGWERFTPECGALWAKASIDSDAMIVLRGQTHVAFANLMRLPWSPSVIVCYLVHLFGPKAWTLEPLHLVQAINERRKAAGASRFYIASIYQDLAPIGRRMGARPLTPDWVLED
jgi:hypothetical protein